MEGVELGEGKVKWWYILYYIIYYHILLYHIAYGILPAVDVEGEGVELGEGQVDVARRVAGEELLPVHAEEAREAAKSTLH